jgi:hypothetical protein
MADGVMIVETVPSSPAALAEYHEWYDTVHVPEILKVEGFVSARRLESLDGESFIAIYEIEGDVEAAKAKLTELQTSGAMTRPAGVQLDPPPSVRYFRSYEAP